MHDKPSPHCIAGRKRAFRNRMCRYGTPRPDTVGLWVASHGTLDHHKRYFIGSYRDVVEHVANLPETHEYLSIHGVGSLVLDRTEIRAYKPPVFQCVGPSGT